MSTTKAAAAPESGGSASSQIEEGDDRAYLEARWRAVVGKGDGGAEAAAAAAGWWEQVAREYGGPGRRWVYCALCVFGLVRVSTGSLTPVTTDATTTDDDD